MKEIRTVAVLGTGIMGAGMAANLVRAGFKVRVWNRTPAKAEALADLGASVTGTPAEAVAEADAIITMLFDADSTLEVLGQASEGLTTEAVWIQSATVGVEGCQRLAELAEELDLIYVDAPVLGTKQPARDGALVILASGPQEARQRCAPVFEAVGRRTVWAGSAGCGSRLKLACNAWVVAVVEGVSEAITLAETLDIPPRLLLETLEGGPLDTPYMRIKGNMIMEGDFSPSFALSAATKDVRFMIKEARAAGVELELLEGIAQRFERGVAEGLGDLDLSATYLTGRRP